MIVMVIGIITVVFMGVVAYLAAAPEGETPPAPPMSESWN
jgi:hypothetical protein